ncbi:MAG: hypothetical protein E2597_01070 [Stenotrophomonas sp.]|nr:hypothetical protein [Stenotrophomonas sp.]
MSNDKKTLADAQPGGRVRLGDQAERARFEQYRGGDFERDAHGYYTNPSTAQDWAMWQAALSAQPSPVAYHGDVDLKWLSGSIGEVAHRLSTYMPTGLAEWADRARDCRIAAQVLSELSAQPSPGGQGDSRIPFETWAKNGGFDVSKFKGIYNSFETRAAWEAWLYWQRLAARQPVGELVPVEIPQGAIINGAAFADRLEHDYQFECPGGPLVNCTDYVEFRRCFDFLAQWASGLPPLYAAPPAQAVDLGAVRDAVQGITLGFNGDLPYIKGIAEALALIDSQTVGNG